MDARFYNSDEIDIERLASDLVNVYAAQGYQTQQISSKDQVMVQLKKGGDFENLVGMGVALSLIVQRTAGGVLAMIGQQKWADKAAAGAVGAVGVVFPVLLPLTVTAGVGAIRQMSLANNVLNMVDGLVRQQRPGIQAGPIPAQLIAQIAPQYQYQPKPMYTPPTPTYLPPVQPTPVYTPPQPPAVSSQPAPAPAKPTMLRCPNCNTPYEEGDTFCSGCGRSLKEHCPSCNAELKPGVAFCPKCGASTYQANPASVVAPKPATPPYIPPKPPTPAYTPPANLPSSQPPAQPKPKVEQYYVPPQTQEPLVQPQPKVTLAPSTSGQDNPAATPSQPQRPQPQYYVPSTSVHDPNAASQPTVLAKPVTGQSSTTSTDPNVVWGTLSFEGKQVQLKGERVLVGRYDHDLSGDPPGVDLSDQPGADTTSRMHAVFEHIGNSYTLTDLNSTNATRINNKRIEPDKASPINDGDTLMFGKVTCTYKKV